MQPLFCLLFNIYIDSIICAFRSSDLGCHVGNVYVGCIVYADDIILLSASLVNMQHEHALYVAHMAMIYMLVLIQINLAYLGWGKVIMKLYLVSNLMVRDCMD